MKKMRNINFYSMCSEILKEYLVFVRLEGPIPPLAGLRWKLLAVDYHSGAAPALHLHQAWLVRKAG